MRSIWLGLILACSACAKPQAAPREQTEVSVPSAAPEPAPSPAPTASQEALACLSAAADAEVRHSGAKPAESFDIDGNGKPDPVFKSCYSGNCRYMLYQEADPCPRYLGEVTGAVFDDPRCDKPAVDGRPCRLSVSRFMIHGDQQEYFYELVNGAYAEVGSGHYSPPPKKHP